MMEGVSETKKNINQVMTFIREIEIGGVNNASIAWLNELAYSGIRNTRLFKKV